MLGLLECQVLCFICQDGLTFWLPMAIANAESNEESPAPFNSFGGDGFTIKTLWSDQHDVCA